MYNQDQEEVEQVQLEQVFQDQDLKLVELVELVLQIVFQVVLLHTQVVAEVDHKVILIQEEQEDQEVEEREDQE